jgi:hypothetical protein
MRLDDGIQKNVVFLGVLERGIFRAKATAFFASVTTARGAVLYLVTAEHVVTKLIERGHKQLFAKTSDESNVTLEVPVEHWFFHPEANSKVADVAVAQLAADPQAFCFTPAAVERFITARHFANREFGVGDEIAVIGLFRNHHGREKNVPVVRCGNLAALPANPVRSKWGEFEAYLIELRSLGGLGGSPVFLISPNEGVQYLQSNNRGAFLLGVMIGHFDITNLKEDAIIEETLHEIDERDAEAINSGIGLVIPAYRILETINRDEFAEAQSRAFDLAQRSGGSYNISRYLQPAINSELVSGMTE